MQQKANNENDRTENANKWKYTTGNTSASTIEQLLTAASTSSSSFKSILLNNYTGCSRTNEKSINWTLFV